MKKLTKSNSGVFKKLNTNKKFILGVLVGGIIFSGITAYATGTYQASQIEYKNNKMVDTALNELYTKANALKSDEVNLTTSYTTVSLGFRPSKVILVSPSTTSNYTLTIVKDTTNNMDFYCYTDSFNNYTRQGAGCHTNGDVIEFLDNGFKAKVGVDATSGKYYYYVFK